MALQQTDATGEQLHTNKTPSCTCESWDIMEALHWQRILPQVPRSEANLLGEGPASLSLLSWGLQGGLRGVCRRRRGRIEGVRQCDRPAEVQGDGCLRPLTAASTGSVNGWQTQSTRPHVTWWRQTERERCTLILCDYKKKELFCVLRTPISVSS